jgi:hypothetical protein
MEPAYNTACFQKDEDIVREAEEEKEEFEPIEENHPEYGERSPDKVNEENLESMLEPITENRPEFGKTPPLPTEQNHESVVEPV